MSFLDTPALAFALAMVFGVIAQAVGRHALIPGIVVLLGTGVLLGPDVADVIRPEALGSAKSAIVGFAVAIIMFEGGMRLEIGQLRKQAHVIRRLVLLGAVITAVGAAAACYLLMGWDLRLSILFGTLVIVTGPTVVGPLVRRIRLAPSLATILEAEGVFIDAIGAMIAIMALEVALSPSTGRLEDAALDVVRRLGIGAVIGVTGGFAIGGLLRVPRLVPRGMENILALVGAVAVYELSHALISDSGIPAAMIAGLVVGNMRIHRMSELVEFKEQLTVLLIGTLFVLLAADVRMADVAALGWPALAVVAALSLIVRPVEVMLCTVGTGLGLKDKAYLSWIAPRGIVAAAVASLFAEQLGHAHIAGGVPLRALVFTVIAVTVTLQGLTAGPLATLLGLRRATNQGYVLLGANPLARCLAERLAETGEPVELIDYDAEDCRAAEELGLKVIHGNGLETRTLLRARIDARTHAIAVTSNEGVNLLFAERIVEDFYGPSVLAAIDPRGIGVHPEMLTTRGVRMLFGRPTDVAAWCSRWRRGHVELVRKRYLGDEPARLVEAPAGSVLPLIVERRGRRRIVDEQTIVESGDVVDFAIATEHGAQIESWWASGPWGANDRGSA
ncbi:MAG TPA: cation:proton antiporter [Kofleriaceae bacterium]